jgi:quinol monooxygenase YgiN
MGLIPATAVRDPHRPVCIVHHVQVKPGLAEAYRDYVLRHYITPANREPGCDLYDVWQDTADPLHFVVVEQWATLAALETHMQKPYVLAGLARAREMQQGQMKSYFLSSTRSG